jgi:NADH:ubiquinone oxidoreductase subunit F (NADH-binding)
VSSGAGLPRLLAGLDTVAPPRAMTLAQHQRVHGPPPALASGELIELVARSGLRGRGGADFPVARKLAAVAERRRASAVVVNGSETEPASDKDRLLLGRVPHLVLDGALLAAAAVGAREVIVKLGSRSRAAGPALEQAIAARDLGRISVALETGPEGYVSGEESAVLQHLNGGRAVPTFKPPRPDERGYRSRPTLVQNPETLAQVALVARHGDRWYRELGTAADPGSALVTVSGAVRHPGVYELAFGTPIGDLLGAAGGSTEPLQALLVGGYFGTWIPAAPALALALARADLGRAGATLGAGVVVALGERACGLHESARVLAYLAGQSAGQCGPCVHGLAAVAEAFGALADGRAGAGVLGRVRRWTGEIAGRGACHHPDGAVRFADSALRVFEAQLDEHRRGTCRARTTGVLRVPRATTAAAEPPVGARRRALARAG